MKSKTLPYFGALLLALLLLAPAQAQNQQELNQQAYAEFVAADEELNSLWKSVISRLQPPRRDKVIAAQLAWLSYRDAEVAARVSFWEGGSMAPLIFHSTMAELTKARSKLLRRWLEDFS